MLILHWGKNAHLIESGCNTPDGDAILIQRKDHLHILTDCFIHDKLIFIVRGLFVAVGSKSPYKLTVLLLDLQAGTDFHGNILAIGVVNQVLKRDDKRVGLRIAGQTVISVIDCDKADAKLREYFLKIASTVNVISRKPAEVFDYDAVNRTFANCLFQLFEARTIEGNAAISIVDEWLADNFQIIMLCNEILADCLLACDGVAFNFVSILTGQSAVDRRSVYLFGHKNNLRSSVWCDTSNQKDEGFCFSYGETRNSHMTIRASGLVRIFFLT